MTFAASACLAAFPGRLRDPLTVVDRLPGADIVEIGDHGMRRVRWEQLELVDHWLRYMNDSPWVYLRHVVE